MSSNQNHFLWFWINILLITGIDKDWSCEINYTVLIDPDNKKHSGLKYGYYKISFSNHLAKLCSGVRLKTPHPKGLVNIRLKILPACIPVTHRRIMKLL